MSAKFLMPTVNKTYRVGVLSNDGQFSITFCETRSTDSEVDTGGQTNTQACKQWQNFVSLILLALKGESSLTRWLLLKWIPELAFYIIHHEAIQCSYICRPDACVIQFQNGTSMKPNSTLLECDATYDGLSENMLTKHVRILPGMYLKLLIWTIHN